MVGRHELKFHINTADYAQLRSRLRIVAKPDENALADGAYMIRSLYFDNYSDKAVMEKLSGISKREKYRLRYYNGDTSFIRLERKSKENLLCYKESAMISAEQCTALLEGNHNILNAPETPLFMGLYIKIHTEHLRPKNIVDYRREAFAFQAGNVRVTFDSSIRASNSISGFLQPSLTTIPVANTIVMEIKYDGYIPDIISNLVQIDRRSLTEFSKYAAARLM